jgi:hypothetical protein
MEGYIYKLISPSGKCYIGQTINMNRRLSDYRRFHHYENQSKLFNAIKKYGFDTFVHEILETITLDSKSELQEKLNELEVSYILEYDCVKSGYNICIKQTYGFIWKFKVEDICDNIEVDLTRKKRVSPKGVNAKKVYQYSKDGQFIKEFNSLTEASELHLIPTTNISKCSSGQIKTAGGYI